MSKRKTPKAKRKAGQPPAETETPLQQRLAAVSAARADLDRAMELLDKARANCRQCHARVTAAEAKRADFIFGVLDEGSTALML